MTPPPPAFGAAVPEWQCLASTDAGIVTIWDPAAFTLIDGYGAWEATLLEDEDIGRHINAGHLVPISIGGDGAWQILVRTGTTNIRAALTDRERRYLLVSSQPYLFVSTGTAIITGYEKIDHDPQPDLPRLKLTAGRHAVTIHLIDWEAEPGGRGADNKPSPTALPDFVVLVDPEPDPAPNHRKKVQTFDRPPN